MYKNGRATFFMIDLKIALALGKAFLTILEAQDGVKKRSRELGTQD